MTAINPARLKIQAAELCEKAAQPDRFVSGLHDLLTFYASRIRHNELSTTPLALQSYQVPPPVLRSLVKELRDFLEDHPKRSLNLIDRLWKEDWVEFRQLAITTLGNLPPDKSEAVLRYIREWLESCPSETIRQEMMIKGLNRLRQEEPSVVINFLEQLIASDLQANHQAAIFGLRSLVNDPAFEDFPTIFKLLGGILLKEESGLLKEIKPLISDLRDVVEEETAYFLMQQLPAAAKPRIIRLVRSTAGEFSQKNSLMLREALSSYSLQT